MLRRTLALPLVALLGCAATPPAAAPPVSRAQSSPPAVVAPPAADDSMGQIDFHVTGSAECQEKFNEGMLALDSFLYDQAHVTFAAALAADPKCAMAAWGDAMAYDKALWYERDTEKGRAALARVTGEDALTAKERAYLGAARALFSTGSIDDGHTAWLAAAAAMHEQYQGDDEVVLQHALALLSLYADDGKAVRHQMEAGAMALQVFGHNPRHPGAAHYVIHSFDSRDHAILALPAARTYAAIAPAASHALHMPSHIFVHLGMWKDVVPSNERAYAASVAWEKSRGHTPSEYDWHSYSWLVAAHLELGQRAAAKRLTDEAGALLAAAKDDSSQLRSDYLSMVADWVSQTGRWQDVEAMIAPVLAPAFDESATGGQVACAMHAPGGRGAARLPTVLMARLGANGLRAEAAVRLGDGKTAALRVDDMRAVRAQMAPWTKMFPADLAPAWDAREEALLVRARAGLKPSESAENKVIAALRTVAELQRTWGTSGPAFSRTTHELLGEALLSIGAAKDALAEYEADLDERPNRALALLGAARAAKAAGDAQKARAYYATLAALWSDADADLPELAEAKDGARG